MAFETKQLANQPCKSRRATGSCVNLSCVVSSVVDLNTFKKNENDDEKHRRTLKLLQKIYVKSKKRRMKKKKMKMKNTQTLKKSQSLCPDNGKKLYHSRNIMYYKFVMKSSLLKSDRLAVWLAD